MKQPDQQYKRVNWGKVDPKTLPPLDLTLVQRDSYEWFLREGIGETLGEISPIEDFTGKNWTLILENHKLGKPKYGAEESLAKGVTFEIPLRADATLINKRTGERSKQEIFLGDIPAMTAQGTFIINGIERAVVNQLVRSPGAFFTGQIDPSTGQMLHMAEIRPLQGSWLEFSITRQDMVTVRIDRRRKFAATTFLRALGIATDEEILELFSDVDTDPDHALIQKTLEKDPSTNQIEATLEIYKRMRPGEPVVLENAQELLNTMFFNPRRYNLGRVGRFKINKKLNLKIPNTSNNWVLTKEDVIAVLKYLIGLRNRKGEVDDIDHLGNRRVRRVGELVATTAYRVGLLRLERVVRERMSMGGANAEFTPAMLVNARPVIASINDFFRTSQLSTILDQTNPLAEIDNLRRLTVMGIGGISRERASFSIRDINSSQYGRIDPVRSPEGPNIGLVTYLALYAKVNEYGFLETPYRKVLKEKKGSKTMMRISDEIVYLAADDEKNHYITHSDVQVDDQGNILDERVPVRYLGEFLETDISNIEYIDVVPRQVVGVAASLIPFIAHDEANRALMGTHMQCQAVPLLKPDSPVVGTGMESVVPQALARAVVAPEDGVIADVDARKVILKTKNDVIEYTIEKFKRTAQSTCFSQRPLVVAGQKVKKGDVLIDGPASDKGELALGQNLTIGYMSFNGLGYEDAIVVSDRLVRQDILTSINIEEHEANVVDTKLGAEETTRDIPNVGEEALANLDEQGIVVIGAEVGPNDILVGKIAPKGETELTAEERLLRAIFGEKAREVRDTSLRMPHGERGTVIDVNMFDREKGDELEPGTNKKIVVKVAQIRKVVVGDKLAGRHGNKGVISKIVPQYDMPYLPDGTPIDIIISPLSVLARMNLGQLMEAHLGWAASNLGYKVAVPVFEKIDEDKIVNELKKSGYPADGKVTLYDGRTGVAFEKRVVVGTAYIMKLIHMVEDKTHARSTGPYSLVTQQPLGGKAQMGGQRLGEMEVWALEAHRAAHTLQEMLTIKSDDVVGRARAFEALVKGTEIPTPTVPESFKVLVKELQALAIDVVPTGVVTAKQLNAPESATEGTVEKVEQSGDETVPQDAPVQAQPVVADDTVEETDNSQAQA